MKRCGNKEKRNTKRVDNGSRPMNISEEDFFGTKPSRLTDEEKQVGED